MERKDALERKRLNVDKDGFSLDKDGKRLTAGGDLTTRTGIKNFLKSAGVTDDAAATRITNEFANSKGEIDYFSNAGQMKYGGANRTISQALLKAAEQFTFAGKPISGAGAGTFAPASASIPAAAPAIPANAPQTNANEENLRLQAALKDAAKRGFSGITGSTAAEVALKVANAARLRAAAASDSTPESVKLQNVDALAQAIGVYLPENVAIREKQKRDGLEALLKQGYKQEDLTRYEDGSYAAPGNYFYPGENESAAAQKAIRDKAAAPVQAPAQASQSQTINITINGQNTPINVVSQADASALTSVLRDLASAASRAA